MDSLLWAANINIFEILALEMSFFYTKIQTLQLLCQEKC